MARTVRRRVLRAFRRRELLDEAAATDMLTWQANGGFSVDASVRVEGDDRAGIERLVRYCARPPFALERLHAMADSAALDSESARLLYRLPGGDVHGRSAIVLAPLELLERIGYSGSSYPGATAVDVTKFDRKPKASGSGEIATTL